MGLRRNVAQCVRGLIHHGEIPAVAVLEVLEGGVPGQFIEMSLERMVMGRHPNCQIVLESAAVSRHHAQILENHGTYFVEDLRSRNGTMLNGVQIEGRMELHDADVVKVCEAAFRFHEGSVPEPDPGVLPEGDESWVRQGQTRQFNLIQRDTTADSTLTSTKMPMDPSSVHELEVHVCPEAKLQAIFAIGNALAAAISIDEVLPKILDSLFQIFPQADRGFVLLREGRSNNFQAHAVKARDPADADSLPVSKTIIDRAMASGEALLSADAAADLRFSNSTSITKFRIHSVMCAPLLAGDSEVLGVIQIDSKKVSQKFSKEDLQVLAAVGVQAAQAVEKAMLHEQAEQLRDLERDLEFATQVQLGFLPTERPKIPGYEFYHFYEAALSVGGDFFDYMMLQDGRTAVTLGDVAGKGVPAALLMARIYSDARYQLLMEPSGGKAVTSLNRAVARGGHGHRFVTFSAVILDPHSHELVVVNAGHLPPLLRRADGTVERIGMDESGLPLGVDPEHSYTELTLHLNPGETIVLFTDGVTDADNNEYELYGLKRLLTYLEGSPEPVSELGEGLVVDLEDFCEGRPQRDDICVICFRRLPE